MNTVNISFSEYKKLLVATKVADINDYTEFINIFIVLSASLTGDEPSDEQPALKLDTLAVWFTRGLQIVKKNPEFMTRFTELVSDTQLINAFEHLCQMYETSTGPFANAAFGLLTKLLQFFNRYINHTLNEMMTSRLVSTVKSIPASSKSFFIIAECLIKEIDGAAFALSQCSFAEKCIEIMWSSALANSASKAFASFYCRLHDSKSSTQYYIDAWCPLVAESLNSSELRSNIVNHLLPKLFKDCPQAYINWVKTLDIKRDHTNWRVLMVPLLRCAYTISTSVDLIESEVISETDIYELLQHSDESCRLDAFSLVCSAISATREPPRYASDVISDPSVLAIFFRETTTAESRNLFSFLFRRALLNCRDFIATQEKRMAKKFNADQNTAIQSLRKLLVNVFEFAFSQLVPDSSYAQLALSTEILGFFIEFEYDGVSRGFKKDVKKGVSIFEIFSPKLAATLLRFTSNNYDDIRQQCAFMFEQCPYEVFEHIYTPNMMENTQTILVSLKGRQSDGGANAMKCVAQMFLTHKDLDKYFDVLHLLSSSINKCLLEDISVHGHLTAYGEILRLLPPQSFEVHQLKVVPIVNSLLQTVVQLWDTLKPIMTLAPYEVDEMLETSAWRSIKESAILLKVLLNINAAVGWKMFSTETFLNICDLLMDQLSNVTHGGALSAIYPTFVQACELCNRAKLDNKPAEWLDRNLNLLETKEQLISRRSGGIPFLVIGILNSCVTNSQRLDEYLEKSFIELFRMSQTVYVAKDDEKFDIPQVHALNCIKCIFRETSLGPAVVKYLEKSLEVSLKNLDNPTWAIKNGAIMLFTVLQEKLFGSEGIIAALFFEKYVNIKASLLEKLRYSNEDNALFLVLTMTLKLQSFSKDDHTLDDFVNIITSRFLGHNAWKIREMAARSLCAMTHFDNYGKAVDQLRPHPKLKTNDIHGRLLCLLEFCKTSNLDSHSTSTQAFIESWILEQPAQHDWTNARVALLILIKTGVSNKVFRFLISEIEAILSTTSSLNGPRRLFLETAVTAVLKFSQSRDMLIQLSQRFATSTFYEAQISMIEFWTTSPKLFATITELHEPVIELLKSDSTWNYVKKKIMHLLIVSEIPLDNSLANLTDSINSLALVLDARSRCSCEDTTCETALQYSVDSRPDEDRYNAVLACKSLLSKEFLQNHVAAKLLFLLYQRLSDESSDVRNLAAKDTRCAEINRKTQLDHMFSQFSDESFNLFLQFLNQSVLNNLTNLHLEKENPDFEIEKPNLFRNEVSEFQELVDRLVVHIAATPEAEETANVIASSCIAIVIKAVHENMSLIASWSFNVHLDSAIRKVVRLWNLCSEANKMKIVELKRELEGFNYFL